ncbi:MAG TPA: S41 family peptidase [Ktedonobacteraceae bacterium]|nr:S41 family peptidase [Ktedonobacteraceae bacterium]
MSSYDDPRWYEQPEQHQAYPPSQSTPQNDLGQFSPPAGSNSNTGSNGALPSGNGNRYWYTTRRNNDPEPRPFLGFWQFVIVFALILLSFLGGWFSHQTFSTSFVASSQSQQYQNLFQQAWNDVDQHYVDRKAVNYQQMSYSAIQAMLGVLKDTGHTRFLTPQEVQSENQQLSGKFVGIGISLRQDATTKQIIIISTIPGSPAQKADFKAGDIILDINGTSVADKTIDDVTNMIHGKAGTSLTITVQRPSTKQQLNIKVTRAEITVPNVLMYYIPQDHIADIQIVQFASGVSVDLRHDLDQAKKLGATSVVLDLRDNPGGYLSEAIDTASEFMSQGVVLIEQDSTGARTSVSVTGDTVNTTIPIVVLTNNNTASAAEIVTAALKDNHRATVVGAKTFGTGTVLEEYPLSDGSALLLGTQEWLTPDGQFIRDKGVAPTIAVALSPKANELTPDQESSAHMTEQQILDSGDNQLAYAIHYLQTRK